MCSMLRLDNGITTESSSEKVFIDSIGEVSESGMSEEEKS